MFASKIFRALALLMALLVLPLGALADGATPVPEVTPTPDATDTAAATPAPTELPREDGTLRVLLTYPGEGLTEVDISLDGSYSIDGNAGFRFARGSKLHVFVSEGEPVLSYEGLTLHMGDGFELTRHMAAGENGLRIGDVEGLYEGDLSITVRDGALRLVLSIYIEDYLKGVVPYEMSDSFPIEALKAQAIAARTYALRRRTSSRDYDVYDNTNDQVFRGYNAQYTNAARAVEETAGIVGTYNGQLSECFYSASNGGQTDLYVNAFGGDEDYGYLDMRDDPYDLANPQSRVKTASVPKQPGAQPLPEALDALLKAALSEQLSAMGYDDSAENIAIIDIQSITPHTPKYDVPSRVYTKLRFKLRLMARKLEVDDSQATPATDEAATTAETASTAGPNATDQPSAGATLDPNEAGGVQLGELSVLSQVFTVDLDIFDAVEDALGLSINRTDNELITVRDDGDRFVIESRRFGHGLGMSQRGAEYMAGHYGWTYMQILAFYYPGMEFVTRGYAPVILPEITQETVATPRPTAEPTPRPTYVPVGELPEGAFYAVVALANPDSTLNLRAEPNTTSQIVYLLMDGQQVIVLEDLGTGWVRISVGEYQGYVAAQYLKLI